MFASKSERKVHYSIRKFSIGVASVAVASLVMGSVVHATENEGSTQAATFSNMANKSQTEQGEINIERDKAKTAVSEYKEKKVSEIYTKLERDRHKDTVDLVNKLQEIKNEYLNKIVESTSKIEIQGLITTSRSKLDEAVSKYKKAPSSNMANKSQTEQGEINIERDKAKTAVSEYKEKKVSEIYTKLERDRHKDTVDLVNKLQEIKNEYLNKIVESTSKIEIQGLITTSRSKLDEAVSKYKKAPSSSSSSGSSTKPETPQPETPKPEVKPEPETPKPEVKPEPETPKPEVKPEPETPKPEVKPEPETPKPEVKPDNSKPQADDKKPSTPNNLSKDKQSSNQASTNENKKQGPATNKPKKSLPSTGSISNLALEIAGLLTLAGATILAKKRMK
ncbi:choline-binding surface protein A [Streptococcus pneumoniae]|nr:choline-binding surface protein A [Streptococcus pneumoniae]VKU63354.1 choline-binding surface protein A [Streptococcus pneumoniae]VLU45158.1 choline-binding surface protein A [Streptococcus pneumoniae]VQN37094.1 choline-binding surface protein A [Streptococcus pneumoniae]